MFLVQLMGRGERDGSADNMSSVKITNAHKQHCFPEMTHLIHLNSEKYQNMQITHLTNMMPHTHHNSPHKSQHQNNGRESSKRFVQVSTAESVGLRGHKTTTPRHKSWISRSLSVFFILTALHSQHSNVSEKVFYRNVFRVRQADRYPSMHWGRDGKHADEVSLEGFLTEGLIRPSFQWFYGIGCTLVWYHKHFL